MQYHSLKGSAEFFSFSEAVIHGQAPDGGLFFPESIPQTFAHSFQAVTPASLACDLLAPMCMPDLTQDQLLKICQDAFHFPLPLVQLDSNLWVLELFHGPSGAFKDVGARFLSRVLSEICQKRITILVATSGDTGGAVAAGFYNVPHVDVVILYPQNRVSPLQEQQLTQWGGNIQALEVQGSFDDCQDMVKSMLNDQEMKQVRPLTSANSINIARWLPQSMYYAWAAQQLGVAAYFVVPSGNFGNLAGLFAKKRGIEIQGFLAATNRNAVFPEYLTTGQFMAQPSVRTPSNAMDVGNPSNRPRVEALFDHQFKQMTQELQSLSIGDQETLQAIQEVDQIYNYTLCPHSAVAYAAYKKQNLMTPQKKNIPTVLLATAHPVKFQEIVEPLVNQAIKIPLSMTTMTSTQKNTKKVIPAKAKALSEYLLHSY